MGGLTQLQRSSRCILQPKPTGRQVIGNGLLAGFYSILTLVDYLMPNPLHI